MTSDEDLRLLASIFEGNIPLFTEAAAAAKGEAPPPSNPSAAAVASFVRLRVPQDEMESALHQIRGAVLAWRGDRDRPRLCVTIPRWMNQSEQMRFVSTEAAMVSVILHAKKTLRLAFPFVDRASEMIFRQLSYAWRRGCAIQLLCRDTSALERLQADPDLLRALRENRDGAAVRGPFSAVSGELWTFHAKVLIADQVQAYVGSANLTRSSLRDQAEMGMLVTQPDVLLDLHAWYSVLWNSLGGLAADPAG